MRKRFVRRSNRVFALGALCWVALAPAAHAVTIDWVFVGAPGNACDPQGPGCFGAVADGYRIGASEVTNAQYAEFLNAVAATDPNALYHPSMDGSSLGGITRSGAAGSFAYAAKPGFASRPVNFVSFYDALRFSNWLHNGQPSGAQGGATTEDGAYTITAQGIADNSIARNVGALSFLPSEDEWYKAAYYDALSTSFYDYPAGSDAPIACDAPGPGANRANCDAFGSDATDPDADAPTDVGAFPGSVSPFGTFDQGGNVAEWNEAVIGGSDRGFRGGCYDDPEFVLAAPGRFDTAPGSEGPTLGFRVASVPEPSSGALVLVGLAALAGRRRGGAR